MIRIKRVRSRARIYKHLRRAYMPTTHRIVKWCPLFMVGRVRVRAQLQKHFDAEPLAV